MKNLLFFLAVLSFVSCKNTQENKIVENKVIVDTVTKDNSKNENINPIQIKNDSIFLVKALPFEVNGIKCYWEFKVKQVKQGDKYGNNILILNEVLRIVSSDKILFETANEVENSNNLQSIKTIDYLKTHSTYDLECEDIDFDGYCDFKILIERAAAGANETYEVFLFNPHNKKFEYSKIFSGTNIEYDKEKNRISFMWKNGGGNYSFGYANLKKNKRDIAFFEEIQQEQDTLVYTKSIGKKIIERKKVVLKKEEWQGNEVHQEDSQYLLERNKK
jgi:hypothetical protein